MEKHRIAVIGYGWMGHWHVKNIKEKISELHVQGIYDIQSEVRQKAEEEGVPAYKTLEELLNDSSVDLITIATPNNFHKELAIKCLKAGKNVISEKPVTLTSSDLEDIIAVAQQEKKMFSVHQNRRWDRDYLIVKKVLEQKTIGTPYFIESRVQGSRGAMHGWRGHKINGGGMVLDWGVHLIDQIMYLIDSPVVSVDAHLFGIFSHEVDDNIKIFLRFENGVSAVLEMATNCFINHPRWHLSCTNGTMVIENFECEGKIVKLKENADEMKWEDELIYTAAGPTRTMAPRPAFTIDTLPLPEVEADWTQYYQNIVAVLDHKQDLIVRPEETLRVMKVIDLIFKSGENGVGYQCHI